MHRKRRCRRVRPVQSISRGVRVRNVELPNSLRFYGFAVSVIRFHRCQRRACVASNTHGSVSREGFFPFFPSPVTAANILQVRVVGASLPPFGAWGVRGEQTRMGAVSRGTLLLSCYDGKNFASRFAPIHLCVNRRPRLSDGLPDRRGFPKLNDAQEET